MHLTGPQEINGMISHCIGHEIYFMRSRPSFERQHIKEIMPVQLLHHPSAGHHLRKVLYTKIRGMTTPDISNRNIFHIDLSN